MALNLKNEYNSNQLTKESLELESPVLLAHEWTKDKTLWKRIKLPRQNIKKLQRGGQEGWCRDADGWVNSKAQGKTQTYLWIMGDNCIAWNTWGEG